MSNQKSFEESGIKYENINHIFLWDKSQCPSHAQYTMTSAVYMAGVKREANFTHELFSKCLLKANYIELRGKL